MTHILQGIKHQTGLCEKGIQEVFGKVPQHGGASQDPSTFKSLMDFYDTARMQISAPLIYLPCMTY